MPEAQRAVGICKGYNMIKYKGKILTAEQEEHINTICQNGIVDIRKFKGFPAFKKRFLSKITKKYFTEKYKNQCWVWSALKMYNGYGIITWDSKRYFAHRISYIIFKGLIPQGKIIRHICNNSLCVNPKHLILGTQRDNLIDAAKIGSHSYQKLNTEAVKVIKWMLKYRYDNTLVKRLAKLYKVHINTIYNIKHNKRWQWVKIN